MSTMTKVFIVVNLVLSAIFLAASATLLGKSEEWKKKFDDEKAAHQKTVAEWTDKFGKKEQELRLTDQDKNKFQTERDRLDGEKRSLDNQLEEQRKQNNDLRGDVGKINANLEVLKTALKEKEALAAKLQQQADDADRARNAAVGKQAEAEEELARVQSQLTEANEQIAKLETEKTGLVEENEKKANALRYAMDVYKFDWTKVLAMEAVEGRVQAVNDDLNFVILSVGEKDRVAPGYLFGISRGPQYIGQVRVDKVGADWSSASVVVTAPGKRIQVQDTASTRL